jgi:hypothetical protein
MEQPTIKEPVRTFGRPTKISEPGKPGSKKVSEPVEVEPSSTKKQSTTIEISVEVKEQLDRMKVDPKEAVARTIERMIDAYEASNTPEGMVEIQMPRNKYDWLLLKQNNLDCIRLLKGYAKD